MPQLTITHADGGTETVDKTVGWTRTRELGHMRRVTIHVERSDAQAVTLDTKEDKIELGSIDTVRLVDVKTGGATWTLVCYSFEWDGNRAGFTPGGDLREGDDQALANALIGEVDSWTAGTVENHTGPLSFVFNHAHRHEALRRIERNVPGEFRWRDEGVVDYVKNLGSDKTASVTISSAQGNVEEKVEITNRGRELDGTHIRVLGAHEGEAQIFANLVPADDPNTYENRVNYTTSRWSSGDARDWDRWQNKDVADQATIEEEAAALGDEIAEGLVEAKATVVDEDLDVGDWVHVEKADAHLDRAMRVHRIKTVAEGAKRVHECLFSTRTTVRKGDAQELEDIQRFNTAFQGSSVVVQGGGSRQPVDAGVNAQIPFDYPDIEYENGATLQVRGLPYRAYSSGAASGGGSLVTSASGGTNDDTTQSGGAALITSADNSDFSNIVDTATFSPDGIGWSGGPLSPAYEVLSLSVGSDTSFVIGYLTVNLTSISGESTPEFDIWLEDAAGNRYPQGGVNVGLSDLGSGTGLGVYAQNANGETMRLKIEETSTSTDGFMYAAGAIQAIGPHVHDVDVPGHAHQFDWLHEHKVDVPSHVHDPQPGVIEFPGETPSGVDVLVNGSVVATDIGSGTFETEVDLTGELTQGRWNMIELRSDTLGHVQGTVSIDSYKQIGKS